MTQEENAQDEVKKTKHKTDNEKEESAEIESIDKNIEEHWEVPKVETKK